LAIETSCDETACAVVEGQCRDGAPRIEVLSSVIASQIEEHKLYGGVVPEIASRRHCESIVGVCEEALERAHLSASDVDAVAVTCAPGLIGALLVGVNFSKGLAMSINKPLIPVHHIRGHIAGCYLSEPTLQPEFLALVVSGGHTSIIHVRDYTRFEIIGQTLDDAAGEAFDKAARAMGLPYPGGVYIDKEAKCGNINAYPLPFPKTEDRYCFSFSGLKTAVINLIHNANQKAKGGGAPYSVPDLAASFQHTVCSILTDKTISAAKELQIQTIALCGGVAANSYLREMFAQKCNDSQLTMVSCKPEYCGDNAAMIGAQAYYEFLAGNVCSDCGASLNASATFCVTKAL